MTCIYHQKGVKSLTMPTPQLAKNAVALGDYVVLFDSCSQLPIERRATQELICFLSDATTTSFQLQDLSSESSLQQCSYIAVGHVAAQVLGVESKYFSNLGPDGIICSATAASPHVVLSGGFTQSGSPFRQESSCSRVDARGSTSVAHRGTMYAVQQFLNLLGFRWYAYDCSVIPTLDPTKYLSELIKASLWPFNIQYVPQFLSRDLGYHCAFRSSDWARRNFINGASCGPRVPAQEKAYDRFTVPDADDTVFGGHLRYSQWPGFEHTLPTMVPAATYFNEHPEWWGFDAKTKKRSEKLQMCFSNLELQEFVAKQVELAITLDAAYGAQGLDPRNSLPDAVAVVQGDGNGFCECESCKKIYSEEGLLPLQHLILSFFFFSKQCGVDEDKKYAYTLILLG